MSLRGGEKAVGRVWVGLIQDGRKGKEERGRNQSHVCPLCPPSVLLLSVLPRASWCDEWIWPFVFRLTDTHTQIHTLATRGSNPTNGSPLTCGSKTLVSLWMHSRPPRYYAGPRRDRAGHHVTSAHCSNWLPRGASVKWHDADFPPMSVLCFLTEMISNNSISICIKYNQPDFSSPILTAPNLYYYICYHEW